MKRPIEPAPATPVRRAPATLLLAAACAALLGLLGAGAASARVTATPSNVSVPTISGTAQQGQTLTGSSGTWNNSPTSFAYQWERCDSSGSTCGTIAGATGNAYTLVSADVGATLRVLVTASNSSGSAAAISAATAVVSSAAAKPTNTSAPTVSGTVQVGGTLTVSPGSWTGTQPISFSYQWMRCDTSGGNCAFIANAVAQTYTVTSADAGHRVVVVVTAANSVGTSQSTATAGNVPASKPVEVAAPTVSGSVQVGQVLTVYPGSWTGAQPISFSYQWERCDTSGGNCASIGGAVGQTYRLSSADAGHRIVVVVTARNSGGTTQAVATAGNVGSNAPVLRVAPAISGTPRVGQTLRMATGSWSTSTPLTAVYQLWQRCDANGNACAGIPGASARTYLVAGADVGHRLRARVTAVNRFGSAVAVSAPTAVVGAASAVAPAAIRLPGGGTSVPVSGVSLPQRLMIDRVQFTPQTIANRRQTIILRVHVRDTRGDAVRGALVFARGVPSHRVSSAPERATGVDGWVTFTFQPQRGLPLRRGATLVMFLRARRAGQNVLGGVTVRRLVQVRVVPRG